MGQLIPSNAIIMKNGLPVTTSRYVAEAFSKQHKDVLRSINNLDCTEEFGRLNFAPSSYKNEQNKVQPMYHLTKNGFMFLVMGFSGHEAARVKEDYIRAFDMMLEELQAPQMIEETMPVKTSEYWQLRAENAELKLQLATGKKTPKRRNWQPDELNRMIAFTRQGFKPTAIGEKLGRSPDSVETKQRELRMKGRI